jgi:hypothetical protein
VAHDLQQQVQQQQQLQQPQQPHAQQSWEATHEPVQGAQQDQYLAPDQQQKQQ